MEDDAKLDEDFRSSDPLALFPSAMEVVID